MKLMRCKNCGDFASAAWMSAGCEHDFETIEVFTEEEVRKRLLNALDTARQAHVRGPNPLTLEGDLFRTERENRDGVQVIALDDVNAALDLAVQVIALDDVNAALDLAFDQEADRG